MIGRLSWKRKVRVVILVVKGWIVRVSLYIVRPGKVGWFRV